MAALEQIRRFFPKAVGMEDYANKVTTVEVPDTAVLLTCKGVPVLLVKAKPGEGAVIVGVYTTIGADLTLTVKDPPAAGDGTGS
ncbi:MAG: hypothetical protein L0Z62_27840 [Gemmataceae bacterium]|nr:hypothetical protein [Gemmataceae bacterium]